MARRGLAVAARPLPALALALLAAADARADVAEIAVVEDASGEINGAIALPNVYLAKAACAFYKSHKDSFDALFVFTTIPQNFFTNVQQGWPVKQLTKGIGRDTGFGDQTAAFCSSSGKLRQAVKMGDLGQLPDDTDKLYTGIPFYPLSGIELMAHEFGHHWLASIRFDKGDGKGKHCRARGFEPTGSGTPGPCDGYEESDFNQHWSYFYSSGSVMYGSMVTDLGGGKFKLVYDKPRFSPLDQYLMGIRAKSEVPPQLVVVTSSDLSGSASLPLGPGKSDTVSGTRLDFTVDDVVRAEGPRVPALEPCHWTAAIVVVHAAGKPPTSAEIAKLDKYRTRWESFYSWATDGRGSFDTTLDNRGKASCVVPSPADGSSTPRDASVARDLAAARERAAGGDRGTTDAAARIDTAPAGAGGDGCGCEVARAPDPAWPVGLLLLAAATCSSGRCSRSRRRRCRCS